MTERGLRAAGYRTGLYTSPHLTHLEERIALDGVPVAPATLDDALGRVEGAARALRVPPTFFEATTAVALEVFRERAVDIAVLEVGLGGRLDATNVVDPIAIAITSIDFDHMAELGDTIEAIAAEKAGLIRRPVPVVLGRNPAPVRDVVARQCEAVGARLHLVASDTRVEAEFAEGRAAVTITTPHATYGRARLSLRGRHQVDNAVTAVRLLEETAVAGGLAVGAEAIRAALEETRWPARLEMRSWQGREVLVDAAHNPGGARALAAFLREVYGRPLPMVIAVMRDKAIDDMLDALAPAASHVVFTAPATPRAERPELLVSRLAHRWPDLPGEAVLPPARALARAVSLGEPAVVAGSLYLAGEIRPLLS